MGYVENVLGYSLIDSVDQPYNGWSTYETWLFNVHDDGNMFDDYTQQAWTDIQKNSEEYETEEKAVKELLNRVADYAKEEINELFDIEKERNALKKDFLVNVIDRVNWHEIALHYIDDLAEREQPLWKRVEITHAVHTGFPGRLPDESQWFANEDEAITYYNLIKKIAIEDQDKVSDTPNDPNIIHDSIVTEIHPKRYEVTWGDKGAGYAVWIEDVEPGKYIDEEY
jgi:hypothetical protein